MSITLEEGQLYAQPSGQSRRPIFAEADDLFFLRQVDAQIRFTRDASGEVTQLTILQSGREQPATKVR